MSYVVLELVVFLKKSFEKVWRNRQKCVTLQPQKGTEAPRREGPEGTTPGAVKRFEKKIAERFGGFEKPP